MPSVLAPPEPISEVSEYPREEKQEACPTYKAAPSRSRLAAFLRALHRSSRRESHVYSSQPAELQSVNILARDYPYVYIRLVCS